MNHIVPKLTDNFRLSGPFFKSSNPYGTFSTCHRDEFFLNRKLEDNEQKTEFQKITGERCLGNICFYHRRGEYVINNLYPTKAFKTLEDAINFLIKNDGKLVFCS